MPADARNPPRSPSMVFPGLMDGAIFVRPIALPTSSAPMSLNLATTTIHKQKRPKPSPFSTESGGATFSILTK